MAAGPEDPPPTARAHGTLGPTSAAAVALLLTSQGSARVPPCAPRSGPPSLGHGLCSPANNSSHIRNSPPRLPIGWLRGSHVSRQRGRDASRVPPRRAASCDALAPQIHIRASTVRLPPLRGRSQSSGRADPPAFSSLESLAFRGGVLDLWRSVFLGLQKLPAFSVLWLPIF